MIILELYLQNRKTLMFGHYHVEDLAFDVRLPLLNKSLSRWSAGKEEFWTKMKRATNDQVTLQGTGAFGFSSGSLVEVATDYADQLLQGDVNIIQKVPT